MGSTNYDKTPLQLVQLGPSSQNDDNPNLILNEVNFATLIEKIGERPLSVYCLTGPQKTGKSLLFGYMVQYLTAAENDNPDWIEPTGSDDKLTQELQWSTEKLIGASPGEPGIWCFNRPFILSHGEDQNRKEVAVLLLYAQMSGKYRWSSIDSALIGLAISAASCTIFNVEKEINERILSAIASHAQYALHGTSPNDMSGSLGQAVFVIRDWNFPTEFPYGISGGNKFLMDEKLCDNSTRSREARVNRSFIKSAFDKISGCLLPFPGLQVLSSEFGGSTSEMDDQFVDELEHFICDIINLDKPLLKHDVKRQEIHGGLQWKSALENFIKTCNHEQLDTKKLLKARGVNCNPSVEEQKEMMKIGVKMYRQVWHQSGKDWNSMKEKEFKDLQRRAKNKAMEAWKKEIVGDSESEDDGDEQESTFSVDQGVERHFMAKLDEKFEKMKLSRTRKQEETIENCKIDMIAQYEKSLEAVLSPEKGKSFSREKIKRHSEEMIGCLVADFEDRTGEKSPQIVKNEFKEKLVQIEAKMIDRVFSTPINADDNCYSLLNTETMNSDEEDTVASNMGSLKTKKYPPVTDMDFKYLSLPNIGGLQENCVKADGAHQKIAKDQLKEQTAKLIDNLKDEYSLKLQKSVSLEKNEAVDEEKSKVIHNFEAHCSYEKGTEEFQQYRSILEKELNLVLVNLKMKRDKENRTKDNRLNEAVVAGLQSYLDKLKRFVLDRNGKVTTDDLEHASAQYLNAELEALSSQFHESIGGEVIKYREELEEKIGNAFINFRKDHVTSQTIADQQVMTLINNTIHEYETEMKSSMCHAKNEEDLSVAHIDTMGRTMEKLRAKSDKITDAHLNNLKSDLEAAFSQLRGKFQLKLDGEAGTEKLTLSNSRAFYCAEMEKHLKNHDFIAPEELSKIHEQVWETALTRISNDDKKNELMEMLEEAWIKYRDANQMNMDAEPVIGIDLGTTFSCVSIYQRGEIKIIPNSMGKLTTPSYVLFRESGKKIVGEEAKNRAYENPEGTIFDAKRILGRKFDDEKLQEDMKLWPFSVVDGGRGVPMFEINGKRLHPEMVSAIVLAKLKKDAEAYLKQKVKKAVITVPAYFTEGQKLATAHAGKIAGLEVLSTITEPVAAAMAYNLQYGLDDQKVANGGLKERHILIFDLGGGTFDVAVLKTKKGKIETLTIDGDTHLGGEDFDKNMMLYCAEEFKKIHQVDLFKGKDSPVKKVRDEVRRRLKRLQGECEQQKIFLATGRAVNICVSRIYNGIDLNVTITRKAFEKMNDKLFQSTIQIVEKALKSANVDKSQIDDIVLVGGSTRIPKIQRLLRDYFNGKPLNMKINPDEAVAHGAGLFAAIKKGTVTKDSPAFTRIQDVTPMPIGVEIYGGGFSTIIPKSTKIPVILQELYKTAHNNQTSVQITIYEGENPVAVNNQKLGDFYLNGIPPKDAGEENIEVEMVVNEDGILNVTGKCTGSGKSEAVSVYEYKQRMGEAAIQQYLAMTVGS